jgi:hypothetical protein
MMQTRVVGACFLAIALMFTGGKLGYYDLSPTLFASVVLISIGVTMFFRNESDESHQAG